MIYSQWSLPGNHQSLTHHGIITIRHRSGTGTIGGHPARAMRESPQIGLSRLPFGQDQDPSGADRLRLHLIVDLLFSYPFRRQNLTTRMSMVSAINLLTRITRPSHLPYPSTLPTGGREPRTS